MSGAVRSTDPYSGFRHMRRSLVVLGAAVAVAACGDTKSTGDAESDVGGTLVVATSSDADYLLPPIITNLQSKTVVDQIFDRLAEIGDDMNILGDRGFKPRLAEKWDWSADSMQIAFHINPKAKWHDGVPVRSSDVRFTFDLNTDPKVAGQAGSVLKPQIDSVSTPDSLTAVFWFNRRYPQQFFDATYHMLILPEHSLRAEPRDQLKAAAFSRAPIGSGRFRFARWTPGQSIEVVADTTNYRGRPKLDRVIWSITTDPGMSFTRVFAGDVDYAEPLLNPALLPEVAKNTNVVRRATRGADYAFVLFNLTAHKSTSPHPLFGDRNLRRALSMALDRQTVVRSVFDTLAQVSVGPMTRWQYHADTNVVQIPFDTLAARALLDSLGWRDADGDGIRERNGKPLRFTIGVPSSSMFRQRAAVLVQASLKRVGAQVDLDVREPNTLFASVRAGDFDAFLNAIHADPSPFSMKQSWSKLGARTSGGLNFGMYHNPVFDAYLDSAFTSWDLPRVRAMSRKAYDVLLADAPALWLYEPTYSAVVHKRFRVKGMRPDAWWANVDEWSIPANERIARDRIGLATTAR